MTNYVCDPVELGARLKEARMNTKAEITVGNLELDADGMSATVDGEEISLTTPLLSVSVR